MATTFTYGSGNPQGVPTVAKSTPKPAPKPAPKPSTKAPTQAEINAQLAAVTSGIDKSVTAIQDYAKTLGYDISSGTPVKLDTGGGVTVGGTTQPTLTTEQYLAQQQAKLAAEQALQNRQSAFDLLKAQFAQYGLDALVDPLRGLIQENISPSEFAIRLRQTEPYKKRFSANASRIANGLRSLSEGEYIALEDQYQNIMRNYGLPATYYTKGDLGRQEGFEKFISGDVSPAELEDRIVTAQKRVLNAPAEVTTALKQFYPDITNGDILAYTLDPTKGLQDIKKKVTAAEIGGAALGARLGATVGRAEELARYGVTAESARAGFGAIGGGLERGSQLASIYQQPDYTQAVAEEEVFNLPGQTDAQRKRKKIIGLEQAEFAGQTGVTGGALGRERVGSF